MILIDSLDGRMESTLNDSVIIEILFGCSLIVFFCKHLFFL